MIEFRLSGGAANANPALSTGGAMSANGFGGEVVAWAAASIPGITLVEGSGNLVDSGLGAQAARLRCKPEGTVWTVAFAPLGQSVYASSPDGSNITSVAANGRYTLWWAGRRVTFDVVFANLPVTETVAALAVTRANNTLFSDTDAADADAAAIDYRCIYVLNSTGATITLELSFEFQPGSALMSLAADPAGPGADAVGVPGALSYAGAVQFTLTAGQKHAVWLRRQVRLMNRTAFLSDAFALRAQEELTP